jgi:glycosyltransferase involved in cell wall biosynthesis
MSNKPRVALISIHPAPYRDPVLRFLRQRNRMNVHILNLFVADAGHPYRSQAAEDYGNIFLSPRFLFAGRFHLSFSILSQLRKGKYDVVVIPGYYHPTLHLAWVRSCITRTPTILMSDDVLFRPRTQLRRIVRKFLIKLITRQITAAWVPGKASLSCLQSYGISPENIFQGAYCLDVDDLARKADSIQVNRTEIRHSLGIAKDQIAFLTVGRMITERGLPFLIEAYRRVANEFPDVVLMMVGKGPMRKWCEDYAERYKLKGVHFMEPVDVELLIPYYVACDCYVISSVNETYSLAVAHAAISSRPTIATDHVGAAYDYVFDGETGFLVPAGDVVFLTDAMRKVVTSRDSLQKMGHRAQQIAMNRTADWAAEQFEHAVFTALNYRGNNRGTA